MGIYRRCIFISAKRSNNVDRLLRHDFMNQRYLRGGFRSLPLFCLLFLCAVTYFRTRPMPILQRLQANPAIEKIESWANGSQLSIRAGIDLKNGFNHKSPNLIPYFLPSIIIAPKWREVGLSNYQLHNVSKYVHVPSMLVSWAA